jgi:CysZ protein
LETIGHHFKALSWAIQKISRGKFIWYFIPGILFALLFWKIFDWTGTYVSSGEVQSDSWWSNLWSTSVEKTFSFLDFLFHQIYIFFILTLLSPLFTFLSEKVDETLTGEKVPFDLVRMFNELIRMIFIVSIAITMELILMGCWAIVSWMLNLDFMDEYFNWTIAAFFYGFSFYDYSLERYQFSIRQSISFSRRNPLLTLMTGIFFSLIALIPIFGLAIAPVMATIISTHVFLKTMGKLTNTKQEQ